MMPTKRRPLDFASLRLGVTGKQVDEKRNVTSASKKPSLVPHDRLAPNRISNCALDNDVDRLAEQIRKFVAQVDHVPKIPVFVRLKRHQNVRVARRPCISARE